MRLTSIRSLSMRTLAGCASVGLLTLITTSPSLAQNQDRTDPKPQSRSNQPTASQDGDSENADADAFADDEAPELGVLVGSCPGGGVCVMGTVWGSPAFEAGLTQGDYITAVEGKKVSSPMELRKALQNHKPGTSIQLTAWRQGREFTEDVVLASEAKDTPKGHEAWIGVQLAYSGADDGQITIADVHRQSPAEEAGLEEGDIILQTDGKDVGGFEAFVDRIQDAGPGDEILLTILRDGTQITKTVTVGAMKDAPISWRRRGFRGMPSADGMMDGRPEMTSDSINEILDEMRQQIRDLERKVEQISKGDDNAVSGRLSTGGRYILTRDWYRGHYRRGHGNNWYNRNYYRGNYGHHYYRSPRYGNSYYRYGGRSYYNHYPYHYGYGNHNGIHFGRNGVTFHW